MNNLWSIDAHEKTPMEAAREFAATYWGEHRGLAAARIPEKHEKASHDLEFAVSDGLKTYIVYHIPTNNQTHPDLWAVGSLA